MEWRIIFDQFTFNGQKYIFLSHFSCKCNAKCCKILNKSHRNFLKLSPEISSESLFILDEFLPSSGNNKIFSSLEGCKFLQGLGNMKYEVTHGPER